ncbi:proton myo-inositol cotransporter-like [Watersipora subatra]|uniref:proton myo-inositol cotransporter-like n=1 Tax=Watersipora subatra TaxID=2589382 RepID=UPI00355C2763
MSDDWASLQHNGGQLYAKGKPPHFLYIFTSLAALGGFLFGYDTGIISGAIILIRQDFRLNTAWQEFVVASTIGAAALFALVGGYLNDKAGRKPVILLASIVFTSGSLCMAFADDKYILVIGRTILGTGIGLSSMTVPMYIAESAPANIRGRLVSVNIAMVAAGQFIANCVAGLFTSFSHDGWRYMLGLGALPAAVQFVAFLFMPESPRWLITQGKESEAKEVLAKLRGTTAMVDEEYEGIKANIFCISEELKHREHKPLLLQMLQTPSVRRALIVGCGLQIIQQLAGINTVMYYSASIITMAGVRSASTAIWLSALTSSVNFLFTLAGLYLVEKMGRRPLTLLSLLGAIISLAVLGVGFQMEVIHSPAVDFNETSSNCSSHRTCGDCRMDIGCGYCYIELGYDNAVNGSCLPTSPDDWLHSFEGRCDNYLQEDVDSRLVWAYDFCPTKFYWLPMVGLVLYLVFFAPGMGPMPWTINAEIYPLWARGAGNGASTFCNWLFNLCSSISFLSLTEYIGAHGTFWMFLAFSVVGLIFLVCTLPETKGKDLEEIEGIFATPWFSQEGKFQPFNKKDSRFNYTHIDDDRPSATGDYSNITETSPNGQTGEKQSKKEATKVKTRLCTNREISTDEDLAQDSDDTLNN